MEPPLTFLACIAPLQSAICIAHDGGARVKIDLPEAEMSAIIRLPQFRGKVVRVTIEEVIEGRKPSRKPAPKHTAQRGRPRKMEPQEWGDDDYGDDEEAD